MRPTPRPLAALLALLVLCLTASCAGAPGDRDPDAAVRRLLDARARAVLGHDAGAFLATVDPRAAAYRTRQAALLDNLAEVPLAQWRYRLVSAPVREPSGRLRADVELDYRLRGHDTASVVVREPLLFGERDGRWYVTGEAPGGGPPQLWDQGRVLAERGARSLVLGVGTGPGARERLREIRTAADRSVGLADDAWDGDWGRRVVILVPSSVDGMAALLQAPASGYQGIAAVTTGETAGGAPGAPADRVVINPDAYRTLGELGRRIVLTHETAHVATRAVTGPGTPLWLSEGFADWAGYLGGPTTPRLAAPELAAALARGETPGALPSDGDFRFDGDADRLARAYEASWLACRLIAVRWGDDALRDVYRAVGGDPAPGDAVERALRTRLGVGRAEFVRLWREYLRTELG
ncbi:hypothetical protein SRB5_54810 [Streptomyces sp. RB5]|uniref:Lipoprotein n=1 Tax=Streptomyces smaragdinus TaxID=2585196 RepID=A0A7K0CQM6_9ACTN|nr:hypothetical protein [Streptomyces smaragdinus]MQY15302.1 hypothetical protein [Streptomyces smaragdinus]